MVAVHVRVRRVDPLRGEVANVLLDDAVHLDVRQRVEAHVRKVEVHVVRHSELGGGAKCLVLLARPDLRVVRVLRGRPVRHDDDAHLVPAIDVNGDRPAHSEHLVVWMRREYEDAGHPSRAPTASSAALV